MRSYAGIPVVADNGVVLGAQCVLNFEARELTEDELAVLTDAAETARAILEKYRGELPA